MKRIIASISAAALALFVFTSCEDVELEVHASIDGHLSLTTEWEPLIVDPNGDPYIYENFDSSVLHSEDIRFIFEDILKSYNYYTKPPRYDYAVLIAKSYNKLDGKYRYTNHYLFWWEVADQAYYFKNLNELSAEEKAYYLGGRTY